MPRKSKWFRVAVEGATTDGRKIEGTWLTEIAKTYDRAKYSARIFIEHIRGFNPEYGFRAQGDVLAVKTDTVEIDGQKRIALFAEIEPTDEFVGLVKAKQKIYSSIEVNPDFAGSGQAYLVGLGCTDSPASLGTEVLEFAAQHPQASPFAARKQHVGNLFSAAELSEIEFIEEAAAEPGLLDRIRAMFSAKGTADDARLKDVHEAVEVVAKSTQDGLAGVRAEFAEHRAARDASDKQLRELIDGLTQKLDHTAAPTAPRAPATGNTAPEAVVTDC